VLYCRSAAFPVVACKVAVSSLQSALRNDGRLHPGTPLVLARLFGDMQAVMDSLQRSYGVSDARSVTAEYMSPLSGLLETLAELMAKRVCNNAVRLVKSGSSHPLVRFLPATAKLPVDTINADSARG
jgi:hypothetical protein